ncbi:hypothetical protein VCHENC02_0263B, partial [Vibrio harveyi]
AVRKIYRYYSLCLLWF